MSRRICGKIIVSGDLAACTPLSVGGMGSGDGVDLELALDGRGRFYAPGSSLMGPMRHWIEARVAKGEARAARMLGFQKEKDNEGHASFLVIQDAEINLPGMLKREIRDGIQIDRCTGTARERKKYTRAILPRGTRIPLRMELDLTPEDRIDFETLLKQLLHALCRQEIRLGSSKTRGLGRVELQNLKIHRYLFAENNGDPLFKWLGKVEVGAQEIQLTDLGADRSAGMEPPAAALTITFQWRPKSPVMIKAGYEGMIADMLPLVSGTEATESAPVLTGSAIKGIIRSQAARIIRTLTPSVPPIDPEDPDPDGKIPIIRDMFGSSDQSGRVCVDDVYQIGNRVDPARWALEDTDIMDPATDHEDHVAIDRWTGGASRGALFSARTPRRDKDWEDIRLTIDFTRPVPHPDYIAWQARKWEAEREGRQFTEPKPELQYVPLSEASMFAELALLILVLRDMQDGWVPLGFASRRGMGDIEFLEGNVRGVLGSRCIDVSGRDWIRDLVTAIPELNSSWAEAMRSNFQVTGLSS